MGQGTANRQFYQFSMSVSPRYLALQGATRNFPKKAYEWVCNKPRKRPRWPDDGEGGPVGFCGLKNRNQTILTIFCRCYPTNFGATGGSNGTFLKNHTIGSAMSSARGPGGSMVAAEAW